jgi:ABC-type branched-subunit amino acid transport system permease subunit
VACGLAGLAGALYAGSSGFISAELAGVVFSVQALIWVAVGGPGFLLGPLLGVMAIKVGENYLSEGLQESWQLLLGLLLIAVVLVAPRGLAGAPAAARRLIHLSTRRFSGAP